MAAGGRGAGLRPAVVVALLLLPVLCRAQLSRTFYQRSCPNVERMVADEVAAAVSSDVGYAARLLRLHFHDCFVHGCDGSVLLDSVDGPGEKDAGPNASLAGFDVVDNIKAQVEDSCQGVVSCADILALAAREAVFQVGGPFIPMKLGRRDGFVTSATDAENSLPGLDDVNGLLATFGAVGLGVIDLIALSGAHTIGVGHCDQIQDRLPPVNGDALLDRGFKRNLTRKCIRRGRFQPDLPLSNDHKTPAKFDNQYFKNLLNGQGLFFSDSVLAIDGRTRQHVKKWSTDQGAFFRQFVKSMVKMSEIQLLTGRNGEIRTDCHFTNSY